MKILLVVDVQNDFVSGTLANPKAQACVPKIKEKIQQRIEEGWTVMFTQDTHQEDYMESMEGKYLPRLHCIQNTWGWELVDELKEFWQTRCRITKPRFGNTDLYGDILRNMSNDWRPSKDPVTEIELIGFCTDICVISNALILKADVIGEKTAISCDASCCAGTSIEAHNAALKVMQSCQVEVINEGC